MTTSFMDKYEQAKAIYTERKYQMRALGFKEIKSAPFRHHARKNYRDLDIPVFSVWRKRLEHRGYVHVILLCVRDDCQNPKIYVYTRGAFDPILYGMRNWYLDGGDAASHDVIEHIERVGHMVDIDEGFVRPRFRHGMVKANIRAFFVMIRDIFTNFISFKH